MDANERPRNTTGLMHKRRITMPDGRYLIYYTFDGPEKPAEEAPRPEPDPKPEITEERRV